MTTETTSGERFAHMFRYRTPGPNWPTLFRCHSPGKRQWFYVVKPDENRHRYRFSDLTRAEWDAPTPDMAGYPTQVDVHRFGGHDDMAWWLRNRMPPGLPYSWFEGTAGFRYVVVNHRHPDGDRAVRAYDYVARPKYGSPAPDDIDAPYPFPNLVPGDETAAPRM